MGMRLMPKSEVNTRKARERAAEVAEGSKLAESVDRLRELRADEERSLLTHRDKMVAAISVEIDEVTKKRDGLTSEVKSLEKRRAAALKPLTDNWAELNASINRHGTDKTQLAMDRDAFEADKQAFEGVKANILTKNAQATTQLEAAKQANKEAAKLREQASASARAIGKEIKEAQNIAKSRTQDLNQRENLLKVREDGVRIKEEAIEDEKRKITAEWRLIHDQRATLERALNRLKK